LVTTIELISLQCAFASREAAPFQREVYADIERIEGRSVRTLSEALTLLNERTALSKTPNVLIRRNRKLKRVVVVELIKAR
jgi:hypothetical protein